MPSPAIATLRPCACSERINAALSAGRISPWTSSRPSSRATASAVAAPSPVAMTMRRPSRCSCTIASAVEALIGSATASRPPSWPSTARYITLAAVLRKCSARSRSVSSAIPCSSINAVLPSSSCLPSTAPCTPMPVRESKSSTLASGIPRARASATIAAANGCSLPWSRLAAHCRI
ncbi:hypothetical protein D3C81_1652270 [compost metagenome]